jgi:hypothetical protein
MPRLLARFHRQSIALVLGLVCMLSACGVTTTTVVGSTTSGSTTTPGGGTSTTTTATTTPVSPTATAISPTATPAPHPTLQAQIVAKLLQNIAPNSNSAITDLACPAGYVVAGGGVNSGYSTIVPMWNAPINATTWRAEIFNTSSTQTISVQMQIACLRVTGATLSSQIVLQGLGSIASGGVGTANLSCPAGYVAAGGGFNSGYSTFNVVLNVPHTSSTWQAEVYNFGSSAITLQAQIACLSAPGLTAQIISKSLGNAAPNSNSSIADTACPAGAFVGGGGLNGNGNYSFVEMWDAPIDTHTWRSEAFNQSPIHTLVAATQFVCLSIS